jgi:hypothetical protein
MIVCNRCNCEIKHGDEYKIAYDEVWCIECAEDAEINGNFRITYIFSNERGDV